jgi:hypothetical protein
MPEKKTIERAHKAKHQGKSPSTQAGRFVREEMHHIREGNHGARSTKQAIAIGLSKARRAGGKVPKKGKSSSSHSSHSTNGRHKANPKRSRAITKALQREGHGAASHESLSHYAHAAASHRSASDRSASAHKATRTRLAHQTHAKRSTSARKAASTRAAHG